MNPTDSVIRLTLPYPTSVNRLYRRSAGSIVKTDAARTFERLVHMMGRDCVPFDDVALSVTYFALESGAT